MDVEWRAFGVGSIIMAGFLLFMLPWAFVSYPTWAPTAATLIWWTGLGLVMMVVALLLAFATKPTVAGEKRKKICGR